MWSDRTVVYGKDQQGMWIGWARGEKVKKIFFFWVVVALGFELRALHV
jgi:hypothetical protein